jgi:hypothetical protein
VTRCARISHYDFSEGASVKSNLTVLDDGDVDGIDFIKKELFESRVDVIILYSYSQK